MELERPFKSIMVGRRGRATRTHRLGRTLLALATGISLLLAPGATPATRAESVGPTCRPGPGILQIVGTDLVITARAGEANDLNIALIGGAYTPPETGEPLTTQVYAIAETGSLGYIPEVFCASDPAATCVADDSGVITCSAILTNITIDLGDLDDGVSLVGVPAPTLISGGGGNDTIVGGDGPDRLLGGAAGDFIAGGDGGDSIDGGPGWDTLEGGPGEDVISGGSTDAFSTSGNDTVRGGPGHDILDGGSGSLTDPDRDLLDYSDSTEGLLLDLLGGFGPDTATGFEDALGGPLADTIIAGPGFRSIDGGGGDDTLLGWGDTELVSGGPGNDRITGGLGDEQLDGGPGDDRIFDSFEDVTVDGGSDDTLVGGDGNDRLVAGTGNNQLSGEDGNDWLVSGCNAIGSTPLDTNSLSGGTGSDTLTDPADAVCLLGQARDVFDGGIKLGGDVDIADYCAGDDPLSDALPDGYRPLAHRDWTDCGRHGDQRVSESSSGNTNEGDRFVGIDELIGGAGNDRIELTRGYVNGGPGGDTIDADVANGGPGGGNDRGDVLRGSTFGPRTADYSLRTDPLVISLDGVANDGAIDEFDNVSTRFIVGGAGNDVLDGDAAINELRGGPGNDTIRGGANRDWVLGGPGNDTLQGDAGDDVFDGEEGDDTLLARDGEHDGVWCGDGNDGASVDRQDYVNPFTCERQVIGVTQVVAAGDTVTTDVEGDGADLAHPVEVTAKAAADGTAAITEYPATGPNPSGFVIFGVRYDIRLPAGTPEAPNVLTFRVDASQVPAGQGANAIFIYRNGAQVRDCDPSPPRVATTAASDPCVASRSVLADGDVQIVVLTSRASDWDFAIDVDPPTIDLDVPGPASYLLRQSVIADYACSDAGSGLASCVGPVADGATIDTASVGPKTFTVMAADRVGNRSTVVVPYRVIFDFRGFLSPLENPAHLDGLLNVVKAGSSVPIKFRLSGNQGLAILAAGSPVSNAMTCDTAAPTDPLEETAAPGAKTLSYDAATDTYTYVWKTDRSWAGTCRKLSVRLVDGTDHSVLLKFT